MGHKGTLATLLAIALFCILPYASACDISCQVESSANRSSSTMSSSCPMPPHHNKKQHRFRMACEQKPLAVISRDASHWMAVHSIVQQAEGIPFRVSPLKISAFVFKAISPPGNSSRFGPVLGSLKI